MVGVAVAFAVALAWCILSIWLGPALGFVDRPDDVLKTHRTPAVPLGGVGVFLGVAGRVAGRRGSSRRGWLRRWWSYWFSDWWTIGSGLDPRLRLLVEAVAGVMLAVGASLPGLAPWSG